MTDTTPSAAAKPAPPAQTGPEQAVHPAARPAAWLAPTALALAIVALATVGGLFWHLQDRLLATELQLARRIGEFDTSSREARSAAKDVRVTVDALVGRVAALESKSQAAQSEQLALAAMYQELARGQDERVVADIEQTLLLAQQQLHLAGNVRAAVLGLEAAEARLAKLEKPQFTRLREAVARDVARLRLLPAADVVGINARLDALIQLADQLKLESEPDPAPLPQPAKPSAPGDRLGWLTTRAWEELRQLIRIRRLDHPDLPLLSPSQAYFLRQNLKLRLLSARVAVLQRDEATFHGDVKASRNWLDQYFSRQDPTAQTMREGLQALETAPVALKDAGIGESIQALRAWRGGKE
jgi:uroporphyrin-III C-methyltransferase